MYVIIYMDVFFLFNFWMDMLLLLLLNYSIKKYRVVWCILSACLGAGAGTAFLLLYLKGVPYALLLLLGLCMVVAMNWLSFGKQKLVWHTLLFFLFAGILAASELSFLTLLKLLGITENNGGDVWMILMVCAAAIFGCILLERQSRIQWKEEHMRAKTVLEFGERKLLAMALMDTGNRLYDPFYHKPVILVDEVLLYDFMEECQKRSPEKLQFVPFHSVGREQGLLKGMMLDRVSIKWQGKTLQMQDVIAVGARNSMYDKKEYQIIFHCGLLMEARAV